MQNNNRMKQVEGLALAGKQVLYNPQMKGKLLTQLKPENPAQSAADVALSTILLVIQKGGANTPPDAIVPAGLVLVGDLLDYMEKADGIEVTEELTEQAIELFVQMALKAFTQGTGQPEQPAPAPAPAPGGAPAAQPAPGPTPAPAPTGLLGGAA